jgi:hypothetical protein
MFNMHIRCLQPFFFFFWWDLVFELRVSHLQSRTHTAWAMPPALHASFKIPKRLLIALRI